MRRDRFRWVLVAVLLLAAGVAGLLAGASVFGYGTEPLLRDEAIDFWDRFGAWKVAVVGVAGLLVAWYGWRLLRSELRRGDGRSPLRHVDYRAGQAGRPVGSRGRTTARPAGLAGGAERALARLPGVESATVRLFGTSERLDLRVQLDVAAATDLTQLRERAAATLERVAATTGLPPRSTDVTIRLVAATPARVV